MSAITIFENKGPAPAMRATSPRFAGGVGEEFAVEVWERRDGSFVVGVQEFGGDEDWHHVSAHGSLEAAVAAAEAHYAAQSA